MFFWKRNKNKPNQLLDKDSLQKSLQKNIDYFRNIIFADDETIKFRKFRTKNPHARDCVLIYAENTTKHELINDYVLRPMMLSSLPPSFSSKGLVEHITSTIIQADAVDSQSNYTQLSQAIVGGAAIILIDNCKQGIIIEAPGWETRDVAEPVSENVTRGPRQGFIEGLGINVSLVRRKIKSTNLKVRYLEIGTKTKTDIAVIFVEDVVVPELVDEVVRRIENIEIDGILESAYIEEFIQDHPYCPFPTIGNTERPDVVAAKLLEGRVAVLVDGTPFALTMPYLFMEAFQANEDYYQHWSYATFHRILRYISFFITTSTPAVYLALITYHPQLIPTELVIHIAAARKNAPFPALVEVIVMGLVFEILREGGLRLPQPVGEAMSIVGAIVLGDAAVSASLVSAPMIIVVAFTGVSGFVISPLYNSVVIVRLIFVFLATVLGLYGYIFGVMGLVIQLASMKSFGVPYLTGLTAFSVQDAKDTFIRAPWWRMVFRPRFIGAHNRRRLQRNKRSQKP